MSVNLPILAVAYLLAGVLLHTNDAYLDLDRITTLNQVGEAALALALWPLLVIGIDLRF